MKRPSATLTKQRIARELSRRTGISNQVASNVMDALVEMLTDHLGAGGRVEIANFLTLRVERHSRLVFLAEASDNERVFDAPKELFFVLKCRPGKRLRERLRVLSHR